MRFHKKTCIKSFTDTKICLTLVIILKMKGYMPQRIKKVIGKMKDERKKILIDQLVELKPKMCSLVANEWQRNQNSKAC